MYAAGRGVPKDEKKALLYFQRAEGLELPALVDDPKMSQARKRDYWLAMFAERQPASPGASREREKLMAKLWRVPAAAPVAKPEEFCPRLAAVMASATANFAAVRDAALPGMHPCSVESAISDDASPFTYGCTIVEDADVIAGSASREATRQLVSQCLGGSWHAAEKSHSHNITVFFSNETSPLLLAISQRESFSKHIVTLTVYGPPAPMTLKRSRPDGPIGLDSPVDFKSEKAGAGNVVQAFAHLLGAELFIDVGMKGKVTLDRKDVPLHEALDAVCAQVGCVWSFSTKHTRPELHIERAAARP